MVPLSCRSQGYQQTPLVRLVFKVKSQSGGPVRALLSYKVRVLCIVWLLVWVPYGPFLLPLGFKDWFSMIDFSGPLTWVKVKLLHAIYGWKIRKNGREKTIVLCLHWVLCVAELLVHWWLNQILMQVVSTCRICLPGHLAMVTLTRYLVAPRLSFPPYWCYSHCSFLFPSPYLWPISVLEMSPHFMLLRTSLPVPTKWLSSCRSNRSKRNGGWRGAPLPSGG